MLACLPACLPLLPLLLLLFLGCLLNCCGIFPLKTAIPATRNAAMQQTEKRHYPRYTKLLMSSPCENLCMPPSFWSMALRMLRRMFQRYCEAATAVE
jgi:hypothetical protein